MLLRLDVYELPSMNGVFCSTLGWRAVFGSRLRCFPAWKCPSPCAASARTCGQNMTYKVGRPVLIRSLLMSDKQVKKILEYFNKEPESFTGDKMAKISKAGNGLLTWVKAMMEYHNVAKGVEPKRRLVEELSSKKEKAERDLEKINAELVQLKEQISTLQHDQAEQAAKLHEIQQEAAIMERRLTSACQLIEGLESERVRWTEDLKACGARREHLVGNCLIGCAFLSYAGPFTFEFRQQMVRGVVVARPSGHKEKKSPPSQILSYFLHSLDLRQASVSLHISQHESSIKNCAIRN